MTCCFVQSRDMLVMDDASVFASDSYEQRRVNFTGDSRRDQEQTHVTGKRIYKHGITHVQQPDKWKAQNFSGLKPGQASGIVQSSTGANAEVSLPDCGHPAVSVAQLHFNRAGALSPRSQCYSL